MMFSMVYLFSRGISWLSYSFGIVSQIYQIREMASNYPDMLEIESYTIVILSWMIYLIPITICAFVLLFIGLVIKEVNKK